MIFSLEDIEDLVAPGSGEPGTLILLLDECEEWQLHIHAWDMSEHLLELGLLGMHEECVGDIHCTQLLALAAVDT